MGAAPAAGRGGTDGPSGMALPSVREGEVPGRTGGTAPGRTPGISDGRIPPGGALGAAGRAIVAAAGGGAAGGAVGIAGAVGIDDAVDRAGAVSDRAGAGAVSRGASISTS